MYRTISILIFITVFYIETYSQYSVALLKFTYPVCSLLNENLINETDDVKIFTIQNQEEFDMYFKLLDSHKINFDKNIVIAGFVGKNNFNKYININGATYHSEKSKLFIKYDINIKPVGTCGKYCVLVIPKVEYKKILILNNKKYARKADSWD